MSCILIDIQSNSECVSSKAILEEQIMSEVSFATNHLSVGSLAFGLCCTVKRVSALIIQTGINREQNIDIIIN